MDAEVERLPGDEQADDQSEEAEDRAEDFDNEDFDEERRVGGVGEGGAATVDTDGDTADEIAAADGDTGPEEGEAGEVAVRMVEVGVVNVADVGGEDDGHDDAVDGDDLAEDDGDQVLGPDARGPDAGAQDGRAGDEDAPCCPYDGETDTQADAQIRPYVW